MHYLTHFPDLDETFVWNRNIDADQCNQPGAFILLVVIDGLSVFQDSGYGLDERDEGYKVVSERLNIVDFEEDIELCLLWQTASAWDRQYCFICQWEIVYRISPWILSRLRGVGVGAGVDIVIRVCGVGYWILLNIHSLIYLLSHYLKRDQARNSDTVRKMYRGIKIDSSNHLTSSSSSFGGRRSYYCLFTFTVYRG